VQHGLDVLVPLEEERNCINQIIYDELCLGKIEKKSKNFFINIINSLKRRSCEGIILGCTEISLLIGQKDAALEIFDTTAIHAQAAVDFALA
jgi:aspartate racemase